ncbi:MAG: DNA topoisomerase III [bacterium]|nr:DNA topoisomerase III [bacterium]
MAKALIITEKPSVARDIAEALGGFQEEDGYWESEDRVITFAVGHLFELLAPEEVDEKYKRWTLDVLPIIPESFSLKKKKGQSDRIRTIKKLVEREDVDRVVNACDAGREGELIFREVVKFLGVEKPIDRLWLQSMTKNAIREGFDSLIPGSEMEGLAQAAECRAWSDWLIGMNATRALTKRFASRKERTAWSAGRVQTPTLALLVERELIVLAHVPVPYWKVAATFEHGGETYSATWYDPAFKADEDDQRKDDRLFDEARATAIVAAVQGQAAEASETRKPSRESAPPLFDLTSLQREGNRRFGWSARRTLSAAQRCYEGHKLLTYPRTDSRCLPNDYRANVNEALQSFAGTKDGPGSEFAESAARLLRDGLQNEKRIFDDAGVSDHFAIIPTGNAPRSELTGDDKRLYDLVVRRFLGAFHPPALWERVERTTVSQGEHFRTRARALMEPGWRAVLPPAQEDSESVTLAPLAPGESEVSGVAVATGEVEASAEETRPPARITEGRLLSLMENAGRQVDDEDIAAVLHEKGIGTPATRAETIENLIRKGYVVRVGKALRPTVKGIRLIDSLNRLSIDRLASPSLTGELEQHLQQVERGERTAAGFMEEVETYAKEVVERAKTFGYEELYGNDEPIGKCPYSGHPVVEQAWFYTCEKDPDLPREAKAKEDCPHENCPLLLWKDTSGRYMDRAAAQAVLKDGQTGILDGFTARSGRTYKGHLELDRDEGKVKVVSEGWNDESASDIPEYEVNTEPLGPCPCGGDCQIIETSTQYICPKKLEADALTAAFKAAKKEAKAKGEPAPEKPELPETSGFIFPRTVCKREITRDEAQYYLANGKTELLTDFTSRFGRPFSAILVLKETGRHGFEFPPRGKKADAEGDAKTTRKKTTKKTTKKKATTKKTTKKVTRKKTGAKTTRKKAAAKATRKKATRKPAKKPATPKATKQKPKSN